MTRLTAQDTDGFVNTRYKFRKDAAVHIVVITDEPTDPKTKEVGDGFEQPLSVMLDVLGQNSLENDLNELNRVHDAVVTAIVPAMFTIPGFETTPVLGVDADVFDRYDVDSNQALNPQAPEHEAHVFVEVDGSYAVQTTNTDLLKFYDKETPQTYVSREAVYTGGQGSGSILDLMEDPAIPHIPEIWDQPHIGQLYFFSERYAFLAWETGGTVWDVAHAVGPLRYKTDPGHGEIIDPEDIRERNDPLSIYDNNSERAGDAANADMFRRLIADDIFEKIKLQVADLDNSGRITPADIDTLFAAIADAPNADMSVFDLNRDGALITGSGTDDSDVRHMVVLVLGTYFGDANLDWEFNSSDMVQVFAAGKYETGEHAGWAEGDWNGDFFFTSGDMTSAFANGGYEEGYRSYFAPIWWPTSGGGYLPTWGTWV